MGQDKVKWERFVNEENEEKSHERVHKYNKGNGKV